MISKASVAKQVVNETGISWYDVEVLFNAHVALENTPFPAGEIRRVARKLADILDAAGVPRDG